MYIYTHIHIAFTFDFIYQYFSPLVGIWTVDIVAPVADSELLVEGRIVSAHVRHSASVFVAHVEELAVEFLVSVEAHSLIGTIEREGDIWELLPSLHLQTQKIRHKFFKKLNNWQL